MPAVRTSRTNEAIGDGAALGVTGETTLHVRPRRADRANRLHLRARDRRPDGAAGPGTRRFAQNGHGNRQPCDSLGLRRPGRNLCGRAINNWSRSSQATVLPSASRAGSQLISRYSITRRNDGDQRWSRDRPPCPAKRTATCAGFARRPREGAPGQNGAASKRETI